MNQAALLASDEPHPVHALRPDGASSFVIAVDHAGARIPRSLGDLGVATSDLQRHIAWDIGALGIGEVLSDALDASLVAQNYSRLVIDCNRDPRLPSSIVTVSEWTDIPGNRELGAAQAQLDGLRRGIAGNLRQRRHR